MKNSYIGGTSTNIHVQGQRPSTTVQGRMRMRMRKGRGDEHSYCLSDLDAGRVSGASGRVEATRAWGGPRRGGVRTSLPLTPLWVATRELWSLSSVSCLWRRHVVLILGSFGRVRVRTGAVWLKVQKELPVEK